MFKVNNNFTRMTSMTLFLCFYCYLRTYLTPFSNVSIVNFEQVNVSWEVPLEFFSHVVKVAICFICFVYNVFMNNTKFLKVVSHVVKGVEQLYCSKYLHAKFLFSFEKKYIRKLFFSLNWD